MSRKPARTAVGALLIGQSPRPDLVDPLRAALPGMGIIEVGALDGLTPADLPAAEPGSYPLTTRLQDGTRVTLSEAVLVPHLQRALNRLEAARVAVSVLLYAGTFIELRSNQPFLKPFAVGRAVLAAAGMHRLGVIVPFKPQEKPVKARWQAAGFAPVVWTEDLAKQGVAFQATLLAAIEAHDLQAIVLDYVGHPAAQVRLLQKTSPVPVVDLGELVVGLVEALLSG